MTAIGSLCSGVGGLDLGLEWAGLGETVWHSEIDPHASTVLAHLLDRFGRVGWHALGTDRSDGRLLGTGEAAEVCGVSRETLARWRAAGSLPWLSSDRIAVRLGCHPLEIWPQFHEAA